MIIVYSDQKPTTRVYNSVFLAGPSPSGEKDPALNWWLNAINIFEAIEDDLDIDELTLLIPLPSNGVVADTNHELSNNNSIDYKAGSPLTVGFHPHHCNLTLYAIKNNFLNWCVEEDPSGNIDIMKFLYHSAIKEGKTNFEYIVNTFIRTTSEGFIKEGQSIYMPAKKLHTVACEPNAVSAWIVVEGKEDPTYDAVCYSNIDLDKGTFPDLYIPATQSDVLYALELAGFKINL